MDNILKYDDFVINEGKAIDVEVFPNYIKYHNEIWPGFNYPKRYIGKGKFKYRVLSREGDTVKPINFGNVKIPPRPVNRLSKKYWENIPQYK